MDTPNVLEMIRPFDPIGADADDRYDTVVRRLNRVRAQRARLAKVLARLEGQFVDNDLTVQSGQRRGQPLSKSVRRRRLARLIEVGAEIRLLTEQERFALAALDRMNEALDRWARETYAPAT